MRWYIGEIGYWISQGVLGYMVLLATLQLFDAFHGMWLNRKFDGTAFIYFGLKVFVPFAVLYYLRMQPPT